MNKYIIKNCPTFLDDVQLLEFSKGTCNSLQNHRTHCQDCTDCVMKQIVELLQQYDEEDCNWCEPISFNTENIYELLKIQEVE